MLRSRKLDGLILTFLVQVFVLEILEFKSDRQTAISVGLFIAGLGASLLIISILLILAGGPAFFLILVAFLFCISSIFLTGEIGMKIDSSSDHLLKTTRVLFWEKSRLYDFSDFREVRIREFMIGSDSYNDLTSFFYIQLIGKNRVSLPWMSSNIRQARNKVEQIARIMNLPFNINSETARSTRSNYT